MENNDRLLIARFFMCIIVGVCLFGIVNAGSYLERAPYGVVSFVALIGLWHSKRMNDYLSKHE